MAPCPRTSWGERRSSRRRLYRSAPSDSNIRASLRRQHTQSTTRASKISWKERSAPAVGTATRVDQTAAWSRMRLRRSWAGVVQDVGRCPTMMYALLRSARGSCADRPRTAAGHRGAEDVWWARVLVEEKNMRRRCPRGIVGAGGRRTIRAGAATSARARHGFHRATDARLRLCGPGRLFGAFLGGEVGRPRARVRRAAAVSRAGIGASGHLKFTA